MIISPGDIVEWTPNGRPGLSNMRGTVTRLDGGRVYITATKSRTRRVESNVWFDSWETNRLRVIKKAPHDRP